MLERVMRLKALIRVYRDLRSSVGLDGFQEQYLEDLEAELRSLRDSQRECARQRRLAEAREVQARREAAARQNARRRLANGC